jgi:hypothetical protein
VHYEYLNHLACFPVSGKGDTHGEVMMTDLEIIEFIRGRNPNATEKDVRAFRIFAKAFECEDAETPLECHEKVLASMKAIQQELEGKTKEEQAIIVLNSGIAKVAAMSRNYEGDLDL